MLLYGTVAKNFSFKTAASQKLNPYTYQAQVWKVSKESFSLQKQRSKLELCDLSVPTFETSRNRVGSVKVWL